ncbi:hypothetical protein TruAng_008487 [Truncatella angustata]|nr:hypothetical protein TruAng_008487 [Truncatella angustata]
MRVPFAIGAGGVLMVPSVFILGKSQDRARLGCRDVLLRIHDRVLGNTPPRPIRQAVNNQPNGQGRPLYNAAFEEARDSLSLLSAPEFDGGRVIPGVKEDHTSFRDLPPPLREMCLYVLQCLPEQLNDPDGRPDGPLYDAHDWADVAVDRIATSVQILLTEARKEGGDGLESLAEKICRNTVQPFQNNISTSKEWLDQFCEGNLRWESIGLLWAYASHSLSDVVHSAYCSRTHWLASRCTSETALVCIGYCIDLARRFAEQNILLLDLCRRNATLESTIVGETKLVSFASYGVVVAMMIYLGLHVQPQDASYRPTLYSETRRRLFTQIFISDKLGVTFTGRPPLLNRRYCSTPLPLDLRDQDLVSGQDDLNRAFESLDEHGWNTDGGLYSATVMRARAMIAYIRDELVEIALTHNAVVTVEHLEEIEAQQHIVYSQFPRSLIHQPNELNDLNTDMRKVFLQILVYLEHLKNIFFTQRLLVLHGRPNEGDLIVTSFIMLTTVLVFWTHRERFAWPSVKRNFQWLVLAYGGPAAGVLCLELLRPTFSRIHPKDPSVSRSSIVQQMSLFVGSLDWVDKLAPDRDLCDDCKAVVQRVLDHSLNTSLDVTNVALDSMDWGLGSLPDFNFELLDTFDWMRSDAQ